MILTQIIQMARFCTVMAKYNFGGQSIYLEMELRKEGGEKGR